MRKTMNKQAGFTLIELVVVIVILGILAVTAAPKFINLQDDAQTATLQGVKGAMESAAALVHSKSLIAGNNDAATASVVVDGAGSTANIEYGYPTDAGADWANLIDLDSTEFTIVALTDSASKTVLVVHPTGNAPTITGWTTGGAATTDANCFAYYYAVEAVNGEPDIGSVNCI